MANLMDSIMLQKIKDLLANNENIGIAVGSNPGIDTMAAALSLYLSLPADKKVTIVCPTDPIVEVSSLVGIDKVKKSFSGSSAGDLTVSFPYKEGEIEKISYTLEEGKLNILVKAGENGLSFNDKDVEYKRAGAVPGLIFVVGTPRISDLGTAFDVEALKDSKVVNIDYRPDNQGFGDIPLLGRNASSVCELMVNLISSLNLTMDVDTTSNLLVGIIDATDNFQDAATSALAFETAAILLKKGAIRKKAKTLKPGFQADAFLSPASNNTYAKPQAPSLPNATIGTPARNASQSDAGGEEKKPEINLPASEDENNPPDDWLAPKIYKGSTTV